MAHYMQVVIQTYAAKGERSPREIRARPLPGQGLDPNMNVECSEAMRNRYPPGSLLLVKAKVTDREGGAPFLYSHYGWAYRLLTKEEANKIVSPKASRSAARLPAADLAKVTAEHIDRAIRRLLDDPHSHAFGESTDYDVVLEDGVRLPPKAVFGIAASEALGFPVEPKHFTAGINSPCFRSIEAAGCVIRPKGESVEALEATPVKDQEWSEGTPRLRQHLARERASGLPEAKKAEFRRVHGGRLFCERCQEDPVEKYGTEHAEACIEVHHKSTHVAAMKAGHRSRLEDLECLCANCHRLEHRLLRALA